MKPRWSGSEQSTGCRSKKQGVVSFLATVPAPMLYLKEDNVVVEEKVGSVIELSSTGSEAFWGAEASYELCMPLVQRYISDVSGGREAIWGGFICRCKLRSTAHCIIFYRLQSFQIGSQLVNHAGIDSLLEVIVSSDRGGSTWALILIFTLVQNVDSTGFWCSRWYYIGRKCDRRWGGPDSGNNCFRSGSQALRYVRAPCIHYNDQRVKCLQHIFSEWAIQFCREHPLANAMCGHVNYTGARKAANTHPGFTSTISNVAWDFSNQDVYRNHWHKMVKGRCCNPSWEVCHWWRTLCKISENLMIWFRTYWQGCLLHQRCADCWTAVGDLWVEWSLRGKGNGMAIGILSIWAARWQV